MESLVDLLPLLFIGLYYLLSNRRKAAAKQAARQHVEAPQAEGRTRQLRMGGVSVWDFTYNMLDIEVCMESYTS